MTKQEIKEFKNWCLIDTVGVGVGLAEYIEVETDLQKKQIAIEVLNTLK